MKQYSAYFKTLHDELHPTGNLGRGTHYSVLRTLAWQDTTRRPLGEAMYHDVAVIWDEDHDERIIHVLQYIHEKGLLVPILFLGERKGMLTFITEGEMPSSYLDACKAAAQEATESEGDPWEITFESMDDGNSTIINDNAEDVGLYLRSLKMLWRLGTKRIPR